MTYRVHRVYSVDLPEDPTLRAMLRIQATDEMDLEGVATDGDIAIWLTFQYDGGDYTDLVGEEEHQARVWTEGSQG